MNLDLWQILAVLGGALLVGLGKGGIPGAGNFTVVIFASVFEAKASVGLLLPVLISADVIAVLVYRKHADWSRLGRLLPWLVVGILLGFWAFDHLSGLHVKRLIGVFVIGMTFIQVLTFRMKRKAEAVLPESPLFRASMGMLGGFATMIANAAGPIAQIYFLAMRLPKLSFIGTGAWCFFLVNVFKVPLQVHLGIINFQSIQVSAWLAPAAMLGALIAPYIVKHINQQLFQQLIWLFVLVAGIKLLLPY